jgi:hypothetical protein
MKLLLVLSAFLYPQTVAGADFRGNDWGDSPEEVIAVEGEPVMIAVERKPVLLQPEDPQRLLGYERSHLGHAVIMKYFFTPKSELAIGKYFYEKADDLTVFFDWEGALITSYGEPINDDFFYTEDEKIIENYYRGSAANLGKGVLLRYFELLRIWEEEPVDILLSANFYEGYIRVILTFYSKQYGREFLKSLDDKPIESRNLEH